MVMTPRDGSGIDLAQNLAQGLNLGKILGSQTQPKDFKKEFEAGGNQMLTTSPLYLVLTTTYN